MTANELRIGNWVEIIQPTKEIYTTIQPSCFSVEIISHYQPIPLTKEWLLRFGFYENRNHNPSWQLDVNLGFSIWGRVKTGFNVFVDSDEIGYPINHVHQLQNLYFALTGEELTLQQL